MLEWICTGTAARAGSRLATRACRSRRPPGFRGRVDVLDATSAPTRSSPQLCPTGAIAVDARGRRDARSRPLHPVRRVRARARRERFAFSAEYETAARSRAGAGRRRATTTSGPSSRARRRSGERARALRRSIHVRHIDCGSDGSEEWEIQALWNPYYDIQRLGFFLTERAPPRRRAARHRAASPRRCATPLRAHLGGDARAEGAGRGRHRRLLAAGSAAAASGSTAGGVDRVLPVDVYVPGLAAGADRDHARPAARGRPARRAAGGRGVTLAVRDRDGRARARAAARAHRRRPALGAPGARPARRSAACCW